MIFKNFLSEFQENFANITKEEGYLFQVDLNKDELWELYLDSFPEGTNPLYRKRREYDCSCCRHFIKHFGNVVIIKNNKAISIWDFKSNNTTFQPVIDALSSYIKTKVVSDVYVTDSNHVGETHSNELLKDNNIKRWEHFNVTLTGKILDNLYKAIRGQKENINEFKGTFRDARNVLQRSLEEITQDSVETVLELISQKSLYKGEEWGNALNKFLELKIAYSKLEDESDKNNFCWTQVGNVQVSVSKIRNHSIGTLLVNISEGMELDTAVKKYEVIVAPSNYKRPKAIFTKKMLEDAENTIKDLGYMESLKRRYATIDDITVNNILFANKDSAKKISGSVFDDMSKEIPINPKKFSRVDEIDIETFIEDVLPKAKELEVLLENRHSSNMVSLIAPVNKASKTMFKWDNNFSWAYSGNLTDSMIRENVKSAGGNVEGVLRFSIQWNDEGEYNNNDFDAHCIEPCGNEIYYGDKRSYSTNGTLDVDIIDPERNQPAVENITWESTNNLQEGVYKFFVHNFRHNGGKSGFKAEIEFDGQIYSFEYNKELRMKERIEVAEVRFNRETGFTIKELLPSNVSSKSIWNLKSNQFIPVSVVMYSPNYWNEQKGIGNRHYMFMLKDCINPEQPNGFYNEFLKQDLVKHKRVFEALGSKMAVKSTEEQLSGIGFSSTKRNYLLIKVKGSTERILKIKL